MNNFQIGDRVVLVASLGSELQGGEITSSFRWRDEQGRPPSHGQVPVDFDNGTSSYVAIAALTYESA